ncbi:MAG: hypothetical protein M1831_005046 [Alyxoria varia]|nr:MAG: hypothetical protein M1831_005046 [Alyxoria varia]
MNRGGNAVGGQSTMQNPPINTIPDTFNDEDFADLLNLDNIGQDIRYAPFAPEEGFEGNIFEDFSANQPAAPPSNPLNPTQLEFTHGSAETTVDTLYSSVAPATKHQSNDVGHAFFPGRMFPTQEQSTPTQSSFFQDGRIPPTPNSMGMYGTQAEWLQHLKARSQPLDNPPGMTTNPNMDGFTPLMTPNTDGMGSCTSYAADYPFGSAYNLSPLTSPAMGPHPYQRGNQMIHQPTTSTTGSQIQSPLTFVGDTSAVSNSTEQERPRKTRKKAPSAVSTPNTNAGRATRKAPAGTGNQNRKESLSVKIPPKTVSQSQPTTATEQQRQANFSNPAQQALDPRLRDASASSSISPRPLSGSFMAAPPKPSTPSSMPQELTNGGSKNTSPNIPALPPATPASMMRLQEGSDKPGVKNKDGTSSLPTSEHFSPATKALESSMEVLKLPEAAAPIEAGNEGKTSDGTTPKTAAGPSNLQKKISPGSTSLSTSGSPHSSAMPSPAGPNGVSKPTEQKPGPAGRGGPAVTKKKRNNSTSNLVSPALRPKISPSIKPLLPEGAKTSISQETQALLLASRSNYQNILEGSHLPGVSYPSELSTNLTSKRTSHKLAEQGRRNRINYALQEMQTLLPPGFCAPGTPGLPAERSTGEEMNGTGADDGGSKLNADNGNSKSGGGKNRKASGSNTATAATAATASSSTSTEQQQQQTPKTPTTSAANNNNSKAATVESAIVYIKALQGEVKDKESIIQRLVGEMEGLRKLAKNAEEGVADGDKDNGDAEGAGSAEGGG